MGANAIGVDDVGGTESIRTCGKGRIKASDANKRKNYLYKTINVRFSK
jgi:hypothetical protein